MIQPPVTDPDYLPLRLSNSSLAPPQFVLTQNQRADKLRPFLSPTRGSILWSVQRRSGYSSTGLPSTTTPEVLDRLRAAIRARHYSLPTEEAYVGCVRRFILFHNKRHPAEMGESEISRFLTHLAVAENVAASTQNQALAAILFLTGWYSKRISTE